MDTLRVSFLNHAFPDARRVGSLRGTFPLRLAPFMPSLLRLALNAPAFLAREKVRVSLEHGFRAVARHFHAFLDGRARLPQFIGSATPEVVKQPADVLGPFGLLAAVRALEGCVENEVIFPGRTSAVWAIELPETADNTRRMPALPIVHDGMAVTVKNEVAASHPCGSTPLENRFEFRCHCDSARFPRLRVLTGHLNRIALDVGPAQVEKFLPVLDSTSRMSGPVDSRISFLW